MKPLYIFDLDGTLADLTHRLHFINPAQGVKKDWQGFHEACVQDAPLPVISTMSLLHKSGADVWIWSGRSASVRQETIHWLWINTPLFSSDIDEILTMRDVGDYRDDAVVKQEWLSRVLDPDRKRLIAAFDDRDRVVEMWRRNGVQCYQVAPGDF